MSLDFPLDDNGDDLSKLRDGGDGLSLSRDIGFSVGFGTEVNATAFAKLFDSPDTRVEIKRVDAVPRLAWNVTITRHMVPDHGAIVDFEEALGRLASPLGGRNHGWGCHAKTSLGVIIAMLESVDDSLTIVAKRPWNANSEARLVSTANGGRISDAVLQDGFEAVLKVSVALAKVLDGHGDRFSAARRVAAIIYCAENDAYLDWLNALGTN